MLYKLIIPEFENAAGSVQEIILSYQQFGQPLGTAPIVLVNHALTGNSCITGENGWWSNLVGKGKSIDTEKYSIIGFNIPGNGFGGFEEGLLRNYREFTLRDIAKMQALALEELGIHDLYAIVGGSIGGALAWELAALKPSLAELLIPIATDYKATDWVLAQCKVQDHILRNSEDPVADARMHAMTFYRTPESFSAKFNRSKSQAEEYNVHSWLSYHGKELERRFQLDSYRMMNHLLTTIDISNGTGDYLEVAKRIESHIHIVTINSDLFFQAEENWEAYVDLSLQKENVSISEIKSIHGHDAFLIENRQVSRILSPLFNLKKQKNENLKYSTLWNW